jgi:dolichyl-phosphate-mannose--protein O-mannosyl transferase
MVFLARRMTGSLLLGGIAGLLLAVDGLAVVLGRTALLDGLLMAWVVLAVAALVRDRDATRAWAAAGPSHVVRWWRPWQLVAGVAFGLACATKWSAVPVLAGFGVLSVVWTAGALVDAGVPRARAKALLLDAPVAALTLVGTAALTYTATWLGWFRSTDGYLRNAGDSALASWAEYHRVIYDLVAGLEAEHAWASHPLGWLVQWRPVLFWSERPVRGEAECTAAGCVQQVLAAGSPTLWWTGLLAVGVVGWAAVRRGDWRGWLVLTGVVTTWLPWFLFTDRPLFATYAVVTLPFLVLAIVVAAQVLAPADATPGRRRAVAVGLAAVVGLTLLSAWLLWPVWTGQTLPVESWRWRMWLPGWG